MYIRKWNKGFLHFLIIFYVNANIVGSTKKLSSSLLHDSA